MPVTPNKMVYPQGLDVASAVATAAKSTYGDLANAVQVALPSTGQNDNGLLIKKARAFPRATVAATQCILWLTKKDDANNLNPIPLKSVQMAAYTMAGTTAVPETDLGPTVADPIRVGPGDKLWWSIGVALSAGVILALEYEKL